MTELELASIGTAALLLLIGLFIDLGRSFRAASAYSSAARSLAGSPAEVPRIEGSVLEAGWKRYRRTLATGGDLGAPRLVRPEKIFDWRLFGIGPSTSRSASFALLWVVWGIVAGSWSYTSGEPRDGFLLAAAGAALGISWMILHLTSLSVTRSAANRFYAALRERDHLVEAGQIELELERRATEERARVRDVERTHIELLVGQKEALARLAPELGQGIHPAIREALESSLIPTLSTMTATLQRLSSEVEETQKAALETMASSFKEQMMSGFATEFEALSKSLHEAAVWHEKVHRDLNELLIASQNMSEGHIAMLRRTRQVSEAVRSNAESLSRAERSLGLTADRVQAAATTIAGLLEGTTASVVDGLRTASDQLAAQLAQLTGTLNEQMEQSGEQLTRRIQSISLMLQRVASDIDTLGREQRPRLGTTSGSPSIRGNRAP